MKRWEIKKIKIARKKPSFSSGYCTSAPWGGAEARSQQFQRDGVLSQSPSAAGNHLLEPHWCSCLFHPGSYHLNLFPVGKRALSTLLSRDTEQKRKFWKFIASQVALEKSHFYECKWIRNIWMKFPGLMWVASYPTQCPQRGCLECQCWCQNPEWKGQGRSLPHCHHTPAPQTPAAQPPPGPHQTHRRVIWARPFPIP